MRSKTTAAEPEVKTFDVDGLIDEMISDLKRIRGNRLIMAEADVVGQAAFNLCALAEQFHTGIPEELDGQTSAYDFLGEDF